MKTNSTQTEPDHRDLANPEFINTASSKVEHLSDEASNLEPLNVAEPAPTETQVIEEIVKAPAFDGNWRNLIERHLKLGIARALAQNCEMMSYDKSSITLRVAEKQKHLVSATYQEKLSAAIDSHFGQKIS